MYVNENVPPIESGEESTLVSPKYHWCNEVRELFKQDPEIRMSFDELKCVIDIIVDSEMKALAIRRLLPEVKQCIDGKVKINVKLNPTRFGGDAYLRETVAAAFKGNPLADYIYWWEDPENCNNPYCWLVMKEKPVFFPESNLHNIWGDTVMLPEDLATDVLPETTNFIYYCSSNPEREMPDHNAIPLN